MPTYNFYLTGFAGHMPSFLEAVRQATGRQVTFDGMGRASGCFESPDAETVFDLLSALLVLRKCTAKVKVMGEAHIIYNQWVGEHAKHEKTFESLLDLSETLDCLKDIDFDIARELMPRMAVGMKNRAAIESILGI